MVLLGCAGQSTAGELHAHMHAEFLKSDQRIGNDCGDRLKRLQPALEERKYTPTGLRWEHSVAGNHKWRATLVA